MSSGPVEQFSPITSTSSAVSVASTAWMSVPSSILPPCGSSETEAWMGSARPLRRNAARAPNIAALTSRMSCAVSMMIRSAPPSTRPRACSVKISTSSPKVICPSVGSSLAGRWPVGPIEPATKRCSPAAARAISAARRLISSVCSASPHSSSFSREPWKVSVSTHLGARLEHRLVHALDHVRAVEHECLVALAREAAVVLAGQVELLERGAHAAVEHDDALARGLDVVALGGQGPHNPTRTLTQVCEGLPAPLPR